MTGVQGMGDQLQAEKVLATITRDRGRTSTYELILEETPNGVMVVGLDHQIIHANPAACHFLDITCERDRRCPSLTMVLALRTYRSVQADQGDSSNRRPSARPRGSGTKSRSKREDGQRLDIDVVLVYPPSRPDYYLLYLIDITPQRKLEGELRRRNAFFHNLIDSSVDGIIASDMKGRLILFNQGAQALLGYTDEEAFTGSACHRSVPGRGRLRAHQADAQR